MNHTFDDMERVELTTIEDTFQIEGRGVMIAPNFPVPLRVPSVDDVIASLADYPEAIVTPVRDSAWGHRAVVADPDGHRVELLQV